MISEFVRGKLYQRILLATLAAVLVESAIWAHGVWIVPVAASLAAATGFFGIGVGVSKLMYAVWDRRSFEGFCTSVLSFGPPTAAVLLLVYPHPSFDHGIGNAAAAAAVGWVAGVRRAADHLDEEP